MNPEAEAELKRILGKIPEELTETDKAFLRARRPYIGRESRKKFNDVFNEKTEEKTAAPKEQTPAEKDTEYNKLLKKVQELGYPVTPEATVEELNMLLEANK